MNCIFKHLGKTFSLHLLKDIPSVVQCNVRKLYSPAAMGMDAYSNARERTLAQFASGEDKFKSKMAEFAVEDSKHMIFTEDLKSMVYLANDNVEDLKTVHAMMKKFNKQNKELRFGSFIFGPVVMRMYYHLGKPLEALNAFKDEALSGMFDQLISYQILMDLLYITGHYNEITEVFEIVKNKQLQPQRYHKNMVVLFYAALYKLNSPEALQLASDTWQDLKKAGHLPMRRATTFAAALALNQGAPHMAIEVLSNEYHQNYITVRNMKARALAELGRLDDVVPILRSVLNIDDPTGKKHNFTEDTMVYIRQAMDRCSEKEIVAEYQRIEKQLISHGLIIPDKLETFLCQEIMPPLYTKDASQRTQILAGSYNRRSGYGSGGGSRYKERPGLADMN